MLQGIERSVLSFFILSSSALRSRQLISHSLFLFSFRYCNFIFPYSHTHKHTHSLKQRTQAIKDYRRYEIKSPKKQIKFSIYKKSLRIGKNKTGKTNKQTERQFRQCLSNCRIPKMLQAQKQKHSKRSNNNDINCNCDYNSHNNNNHNKATFQRRKFNDNISEQSSEIYIKASGKERRSLVAQLPILFQSILPPSLPRP